MTVGNTQVQELGAFVAAREWGDLSSATRDALSLRVLDAVGCAIAALDALPVKAVRAQVRELGGNPLATLIGGGRSSPDRVAMANGAAVRYLDFNDCYLGTGEACHPSDNVAPVLAAVEFAGGDGRDLLTALAVAYQVQVRLSQAAPVRARGFDHVTQGAYAVAAGVAKALRLDATGAAHAIAIAGTALNALRVTRTGAISNWKGLAYANTAFAATHAAFLARHGVTGPLQVFEGSKGFIETISGPFSIDWASEGLDAVHETDVKRHDAEGHAQSALEAVLELRRRHRPDPAQIEGVDVAVCHAAYEIIGPGAGDKTLVATREEADHSLPYMVAVALLDGEVMPQQYDPGRLAGSDVQALLRRVAVREDPELTAAFPARHECRVSVRMSDGPVFEASRADWPGFHGNPPDRAAIVDKFSGLVRGRLDDDLRGRIAEATANLGRTRVADLAALIGAVPEREGSSV